MGFQGNDEIRSSTSVACGFEVSKGSSAGSKHGPQTPFGPVLGSASISSIHTIDTLVQDQNLLSGEIFEVKQAIAEEKYKTS